MHLDAVADSEGPGDALYGIIEELTAVAPDRPTHRGAAETCAGWDDFAERLDWAISTLPHGAVLSLFAPSEDPDYTIVEFTNVFSIYSGCLVGPATSRDRAQLWENMSRLGWEWDPLDGDSIEYPIWRAAPARTPQELVPRTVTTFHEVFAVPDPSALTFTATTRGDDAALTYLDADLGLTRRPQ
ncbi:TY-Chap domain-containing protein [Nocardia aurea]|uniref:TY-Chap domain-containing protein n=1 Tax=Nocardia aurea TaxID=2144174 RepID=UPI000D69168E|nr:hypothetical protein [Nocardia aurea]